MLIRKMGEGRKTMPVSESNRNSGVSVSFKDRGKQKRNQ